MAIGWGIIGIGKHSSRFIGPALKESAGTEFVAVCSRSMEKAKRFATDCGVKRAYDSLTETWSYGTWDPETFDLATLANPQIQITPLLTAITTPH